VRDPNLFLLLPLLARPHRHASILQTKPVDTSTLSVHESKLAPRAAKRMNEAIEPAGPKAIQITIPPDGWSIQVANNPPIAFNGIVGTFDVDEERQTNEVVSQRVAELILSGFGSADLVIYGDQIEPRTIDPNTGAVR
jgi:hypothetical protein